MGVARAPVTGSGFAPAWTASVLKPGARCDMEASLEKPYAAFHGEACSGLKRKWRDQPALRPSFCRPGRMMGFFDEITRELTPFQPISPDSRPYSIFGQRFMTTLRPAASAFAAAL